MLCPNCKNPIEDNVSICEWCGVSLCTKSDVSQITKDNRAADLDAQLLRILSEKPTPLQLQQALKLYSEKTGYPLGNSQRYICKLWGKVYPNEYERRLKKMRKTTNKIIIFFTFLLFLCILITAIVFYEDVYVYSNPLLNILYCSAGYSAIYAILILIIIIIRYRNKNFILY
jgi:magnesium-transporting ATPase (P-type)